MSINKQALWEGVKELLRFALFAAIAAGVTFLTAQLTSLDPGSLEALIITFVLRFVDKVVHEDQNIKMNGLSPF